MCNPTECKSMNRYVREKKCISYLEHTLFKNSCGSIYVTHNSRTYNTCLPKVRHLDNAPTDGNILPGNRKGVAHSECMLLLRVMEDHNTNEIIRSICYGKRVQHVIENALQIAKKRGSALIGYDVTPFILDKNDHASSGFVVIAWKRVNDLGATPVSNVDDRTTLQHNRWVAFN